MSAYRAGVPLAPPVVSTDGGCWATINGQLFRSHRWIDGRVKQNQETVPGEAAAMGRIVAPLHGCGFSVWRPCALGDQEPIGTCGWSWPGQGRCVVRTGRTGTLALGACIGAIWRRTRPPGQFWALQGVEAAIFLLVTAALLAACITVVVRSRPESLAQSTSAVARRMDVMQDQTADHGIEAGVREGEVADIRGLQLHSFRYPFQLRVAAGDLDAVAGWARPRGNRLATAISTAPGHTPDQGHSRRRARRSR
jgi:hypothetical protein